MHFWEKKKVYGKEDWRFDLKKKYEYIYDSIKKQCTQS